MASTVSMQSILDAGTQSMVDCFDCYREMSRGDWLAGMPEYWFSCGVAESMHELGLTTTLETQMQFMHEHSPFKRPGRPSSKLRSNGRSDIMVWWESYQTPRGLIEVKHRWCFDEASKKDIERICATLKRNGGKGEGGMQFGLFTFATDIADQGSSKDCKVALEERLEAVFSEVKNSAGSDFIVSKQIRLSKYFKGEGMMAAYGFMIRRRS